MLITLESTTYPGTTEEIIVPKLLHNGFRIGENVFAAFSPERIDPGNQKYRVRNTPKVVGGVTPGGEHRAGERSGVDVRKAGCQRVGSDRSSQKQALRLYALLSGAGPGRPLHPHRPALSELEAEDAQLHGALYRTGE